MSKWFYELDGKEQGPYTETVLVNLYQRGLIDAHTPVWPEGDPDQRMPLGGCAIDLVGQVANGAATDQSSPVSKQQTDPIPPDGQRKSKKFISFEEAQRETPDVKPVYGVQEETNTISTFGDEFLDSSIVRSYIYVNSKFYLNKWNEFLKTSGGIWENVGSFKMSWNWPAFLFTSAWLFYRGMGLYAVIYTLMATFVGYFAGAYAFILTTALGVAVGTFGNSLYLSRARSYWLINKTNPGGEPSGKGRMNPWLAVLLAGLLGSASMGMIALNDPELQKGPIGDLMRGFTCSSDDTKDLLKQVIDEQIEKSLTKPFSSLVSVKIDHIRTKSSDSSSVSCAANVSVTMKNPDGSDLGRLMTESFYKQMGGREIDVKYKVETTSGNRMYLTVEGED